MLMMRARVQGHRWVDHPAAAVMEARVPGQWVDRPAAMVMEAREQGRCWIDHPAAAVMEARVQGRHWVDRPSTFTDVLCLCLGLTSFTGPIVTKSGKQNDPRLILGMACLESDSAGFVKMFIVWGMTLVAAVTCNSVLGLYSSIRQKWVLLYGYSLLAYVLTLLELLVFLTLYTHMGRVVEYSSACLQNTLVEHYQGPFHSELTKFTGVWDHLQQYYGCCGVDGGKVFNSMVNWDRTWLDKYRDPFFNTTLRIEEFRVITVLPYTCCKFKVSSAAHLLQVQGQL
ncbi:hypothetical protein ACOMHN_046977 [Nucella lapillus]